MTLPDQGKNNRPMKARPATGQQKASMRPKTSAFRNLTGREWQNLAIAALLAAYVIQIGLDAVWGNVFSHLSIDFGSFWSAGYIASHFGYAQVYDLAVMQKVQAQLWPKTADAISGFQVVPTPYLPPFVAAFQPLALLPAIQASWVWLAMNLVATVLYLRYFAVRISGRPLQTRLLAMLLVSVPVFANVFVGQVNTWLMICVGQYMLAAEEGKSFRAGLWLGGLLLKPQCLILIVPGLLLNRSVRSLAGFAVVSLAIGTASWLMVGSTGLLQIARLWVGYAGGLATNYPELMMNWRMLGLLVAQFAGRALASTLTVVGMLLTAIAALGLWRHPHSEASPRLSLALVGTFAGTGLVAWHSHVHMAMVLLPPLLWIYLRQRELLGQALAWWVFFPAAVYCARLLLASLVQAGALPIGGGELDFLGGMGLFIMNLFLLAWAVHRLRQPAAVVPTST
jgi:hypothetical protein